MHATRSATAGRPSRRLVRVTGALSLGLVLAVGLTACGNDTDDPVATAEVSTTEHNDADVTFSTDMIQHHAQALSMVDLTLDRPLDPEVQSLAEEIRDAQGPEIETMADWLTAWGEEVPATMRDHVNSGHDTDDMSDDMDHGDDMPGMMSADDMAALRDASDEEFQTMWLEMMIEHHEGAIVMARTEQEDGRYQAAVELAAEIEESQAVEIETMQELLG